MQKSNVESGQSEHNKEEAEISIVESDRTDHKEIVTDQQHNNEPNTSQENIIDLSRTEISSNTTNDENSESTAVEITTGMETLTTNNTTLNDSRDNDEGFEENDEDVDNDDDLDSNSDDDDDDDGWITPDNIKHIKSQMGKETLDAIPANVTVGCLTTDFAMQVVMQFQGDMNK